MKFRLNIFFFIILLGQISISAQEISFDSAMKKARLEIYDSPDKAISISKNLLEKEKDIKNITAIYMLLSTANIAKRDFDESLKFILKAKEFAQRTTDLKTQASVLVSVAIQYQQMELFSKSLETLNEADLYLTKLPDDLFEKQVEIARSYAIRGMIYKSQSNSEIALEKFFIAIKNFEKVKDTKATFANVSVVYYNIGYCYLNLQKIALAKEAFEKSIEYAQKNKAKSLEAFALKGMAEVYKQKRENSTALELLKKAENLCKNTNDLILNEGIFKEMADNYLATGKSQLYQLYNKKYFEMRFKREQNELSSINQAIDNHNNETLKKKDDLKNHYHFITFCISIIGIIIASFILFFILKLRKENRGLKQKIKQLIKQQQ
ncbi:tetratricopeptide repeat protein [Chryseobacterium sp.]|uniref:tetratricopeptide repeat protein n=1 Tax=Chryseobacterium sp. TaxID=1871047 RepID=UPI00289C847A|nr:tetratricopeptide repeat protein [Chryseobacterium sp.]